MTHPHFQLAFGDGISHTSLELVKDVKLLQTTLKDWGLLSVNDIDGQFGQKTERAVKQFQGMRELEMDGIVGKVTWAELVKSDSVEILPRPDSDGAVPEGWNGNKLIIYRELQRNKFTNVQIAAIMGTWMQESSLNPYAAEPSPGTGLGLAQWSYDRRSLLPPFTGNRATDIRNQVDLFVQELGHTERNAGTKLFNAQDLVSAMHAMDLYERQGIDGSRTQYAQEFYDELKS